MALIKCPECGGDVSTTAKSCPHCGYELAQPEPSKPSEPQPQVEPPARVRSTPLGPKEENKGAGIAMIVVGILIIPVVIFGFIFGIIPGVLVLIFDIFLFGFAGQKISGTQKGTCPYCGNDVTVGYKVLTYKCPHCKKMCSKTEYELSRTD